MNTVKYMTEKQMQQYFNHCMVEDWMRNQDPVPLLSKDDKMSLLKLAISNAMATLCDMHSQHKRPIPTTTMRIAKRIHPPRESMIAWIDIALHDSWNHDDQRVRWIRLRIYPRTSKCGWSVFTVNFILHPDEDRVIGYCNGGDSLILDKTPKNHWARTIVRDLFNWHVPIDSQYIVRDQGTPTGDIFTKEFATSYGNLYPELSLIPDMGI